MAEDAGGNMKARLRAELRAAIKDRHLVEANVIRVLIGAIDNAEAPPVCAAPTASVQHHFLSGAAELERRLLDRSDVHRVLLMEIEERERAAAELEDLGMMERAEALRAEAVLAKRYLGEET